MKQIHEAILGLRPGLVDRVVRPQDFGILFLEIESRGPRVDGYWQPHIGMHIDDEKIEPAVVVEVENLAANSAPRSSPQNLFSYIGESAVAVVSI